MEYGQRRAACARDDGESGGEGKDFEHDADQEDQSAHGHVRLVLTVVVEQSHADASDHVDPGEEVVCGHPFDEGREEHDEEEPEGREGIEEHERHLLPQLCQGNFPAYLL